MKTTKMSTILVLALGLMVCVPSVSGAEPMGTAWTYQGRLIDANSAAEGLYDFQFKLYKYEAAPVNNYIQVGNDVNRPDVDVIDGYFTVELDFGSSVFNGDARWLEIGVRPGVENDPCEYTPLSPRQEVTATPYALQTRGIFVDDALNVGIGTNPPSTKLDVVGTVTATAFVGDGSGLTGIAADSDWTISDSNLYSEVAGNVGIGTQSPDAKLDISGDVKVTGSVAASDAVIMATNTGSGDGVEGQSWGSSGHGVEGWALWSGPGANYGGYFRAEGNGGYGVYGYASNSGDYENYGGYFQAQGESGIGAYGFVMGDNGQAIKGMAFDSGSVTNYGGHFTSRGASGRGVYGEATKTEAVENYGGYFTAAGDSGTGVRGTATATGEVTNYGGYFVAEGKDGRGVYGEATNTGTPENPAANYGGYFKAAGRDGKGVYGEATGYYGQGVYGEATGYYGQGVYGKNIYNGNYGYLGGISNAVFGYNPTSGNDGYLGGINNAVHGGSSSGSGVYGHSATGYGVYGRSTSGYGVYGESSIGYAGYFDGNLHITGTLSKSSGSFKIDHPLDPENKYLQHSFIESPDMMNVYNGNVLLDEKGQACVQLPEYFKALNRDFRYQLTAIGTPAPNLYIAEEISDNRFKIAGGKKGTKVSWQVTGIRQDAYAKANRIVVEENKPAEERGYYLHPTAYGLPEEKGIESVRNPRVSETRQVAKNESR